MNDPVFLTLDQVHSLHRHSVDLYGGLEGVRDAQTLHSAVDQPKNDYYYGRADVFGIAAAYAFHIAQAQAYLDGNKRTGISAALTFLEMHGIDTSDEDHKLYDAMIAIAEKRMAKNELAELFRQLFTRA